VQLPSEYLKIYKGIITLHIQIYKMQKVCSKCEEEKQVEEFSAPNNRICKVCRNEKSRERYKNRVIDSEKIRACVFCNGIKPMNGFLYGTINVWNALIQ